ncbi:MAG: SGNH/GDSL hydrolase family protein [bacterium]|nr:SGNH/GDSL hydrolase family protein [bacterium]
MKAKSSRKTNLFLLCVTALICLIIAETCMRVIRPDILGIQGSTNVTVYDDILGWKSSANTAWSNRICNEMIEEKVNQFGFRSKSLSSRELVQSKTRLMFLGDSYCEGSGIKIDDRLSDIIPIMDTSFVSFNFGMVGYSTDQELLTLKLYGHEIMPKKVILLFCLNDLLFNNSGLCWARPKPYYIIGENDSLILLNTPVPKLLHRTSFSSWLRRNVVLYNATCRAIALMQANIGFKKASKVDQNDRSVFSTEQSKYNFSSNKNHDVTPRLIKEMKKECLDLNAELTILLVPSSQDWTEKHEGTPPEAEPVIRWCQELDIEMIDLFPVFRNQFLQDGQNLYVGDELHWNAKANRLAAIVLLNYLRQRDVIESIPGAE